MSSDKAFVVCARLAARQRKPFKSPHLSHYADHAIAGTLAPTASRILSSALKSTSLSRAPLAL